MSQQNVPPPQTHCAFCGGKLDIEVRSGKGNQNSATTTCTVCGRTGAFSWAALSTQQPPSSLLQRLRNLWRPRLWRRRYPPGFPGYLSKSGTPDFRRFVADIDFPLYGLKAMPHDLKLKGMGTGRSGSKFESSTNASLTYVVGDLRSPDAAVEFTETTANRYRNAQGEMTEAAWTGLAFALVTNTVRNNAGEEQGRRWFYEGGFHELWNQDKVSEAARRTLEVQIAGELRQVETAAWEEPFKTSVFTFTLPPVHITACSLNLSEQDTVDSLGHLAVLQDDESSIATHQADLEENMRILQAHR